MFVIPFEPNSDWDTICYKYETFTVYTSRVTKLPYKLEVFGNDFILNIDTIKIHKNFRKHEKSEKIVLTTNEINGLMQTSEEYVTQTACYIYKIKGGFINEEKSFKRVT